MAGSSRQANSQALGDGETVTLEVPDMFVDLITSEAMDMVKQETLFPTTRQLRERYMRPRYTSSHHPPTRKTYKLQDRLGILTRELEEVKQASVAGKQELRDLKSKSKNDVAFLRAKLDELNQVITEMNGSRAPSEAPASIQKNVSPTPHQPSTSNMELTPGQDTTTTQNGVTEQRPGKIAGKCSDQPSLTSVQRSNSQGVSRWRAAPTIIQEPRNPVPLLPPERQNAKDGLDFSKFRNIYFSVIFAKDMDQLPLYTKPAIKPGDMGSVTFTNLKHCLHTGWERTFDRQLSQICSSMERSRQPFLYLPGRTFFVGPQHAVGIGPAAQENKKHGFQLRSLFSDLYSQRRELFFDTAPANADSAKRFIYYAGTYKCLPLPHRTMAWDSRWNVPIERFSLSVVSSLVQGSSLSPQDAKELVESGDIKLEFIALQCVGFNGDLYRLVTGPNDLENVKEKGRKHITTSQASPSLVKRRRES
ncbi:hypothetical protein VNI00_008660 [Paramarasmius palmivorus]|uniref:Uncharacterized protein n=1 Tax=Paramarasmius palmivorus TaxID=297713 RepID=A0AAW0CV95_9AGAR